MVIEAERILVEKNTPTDDNAYKNIFGNGSRKQPEFPGVDEDCVFDTNRQIYVPRKK